MLNINVEPEYAEYILTIDKLRQKLPVFKFDSVPFSEIKAV